MNQILITEKLYITPELKRKKKMYKVNFIISLVIILILFSLYVYAEYDRNKSDLSQDILASMNQKDTTTISSDNEAWIIPLDGGEIVNDYDIYTAADGNTYKSIGTINIPSINVTYPILSETSDALLKVSVCKFWGSDPNKVGNLCIAGHNYRNSRFFSKVPNLVVGDTIEITDLSGETLKYSVYDKYTVDPTDVSCTTQITNGKKIVTLITCTNDNKQRVVVKAQEV